MEAVFKKVPVEIQDITGRTIEGVINLPSSGYKTRLSDFVNDPSKLFIVLRDAIVTKNGVVEKEYKSIIISKSAIVHIIEIEEIEGGH